jgi:hypothetical protein
VHPCGLACGVPWRVNPGSFNLFSGQLEPELFGISHLRGGLDYEGTRAVRSVG